MKHDTAATGGGPAVAIVAMGGIFPGANDPDGLWELVLSAGDAAREPPPGRWSLAPDAVHDPVPGPDKVYSRRACFVNDAGLDLSGLDIDPALVQALDPMYSLLLHAGRQAFAGTATAGIDRRRAGVIVGNIALPTVAASRIALEVLGEIFETAVTGRHAGAAEPTHPLNRYVAGLPAALLAKALGLGGTAWTLDAACASSLYALKYAVDALQDGRADAMLCGGLSRPDPLYTQMGFSTLGAVSPSGRCAPFDHRADGLVVGEGAGVLVLKRLDDALRDGDTVLAVVAGIGISNDIRGNLMLPDSGGQLRAMRAAYESSGWGPAEVDLIECHGTGTPVGDEVEYRSLRELWQGQETAGRDCVIGSVKSNIGHLLTAAGAAGLIKVLGALRHKTLPPTANFQRAAGKLRLDGRPFTVLERPREWAPRAPGVPRRAAVSAFGFGGINAHVLLEEFDPSAHGHHAAAVSVSPPRPSREPEPIAVIGMDAHFGPWQGLAGFAARALDDDDISAPTRAANRWGLDRYERIKGHTIDRVTVPLGRFRIPPAELKDMLPQQLLMLQVAANALDNAGIADLAQAERIDTGVFIGIGLDLNTTNFHCRWSLAERARQWAPGLGLEPDSNEFQDWLARLRDAAGPPLSANRTMGALGGIVASRITRAFNVGGPGFTVSSEETSGLHALEVAVRALRRGELDLAVAGAVDFAGDVRAVATLDDAATVVGEGAAALVLKRQSDAARDGDRIYALVRGVDSACGNGADNEARRASAGRACAEAGVAPGDITRLEASGYGPDDSLRILENPPAAGDLLISQVDGRIGHSGAAAAMASLLSACLGLHHGLLPAGYVPRPGADPQAALPRYWLRDRARGARRVLVSAAGAGGVCAHAILEEAPAAGAEESPGAARGVSGGCPDHLYTLEADDRAGIRQRLDALEQMVGTRDPAALAREWYAAGRQRSPGSLALTLIAGDTGQLRGLIDEARLGLARDAGFSTERIAFTDQPLGGAGRLAFVFPGSGNHFQGMGREAGCRWPGVLRRLDAENDALAGQFAGGRFWSGDGGPRSHEEVIFGQVWLGTFMSDVIAGFGASPDAVIGYSLGETAGLFGTRTWTARDEMLRRMQASSLFKTGLAGPCRAAREVWDLPEGAALEWRVGVINRPAETMRELIAGRPQVYLLIVNTPEECVIGGNRAALEALVHDAGAVFHPLDTITTVHCELVRPVYQAYRDLHVFDTNPPPGVRFYSCDLGRAYDVTPDAAADAIAGMALRPFDYTRVIEQAYADGVRLFVEPGPGASCTRMIDRILKDRPHAARAACVQGRNGVYTMLQTLALLQSHRVPLDLSSLYEAEDPPSIPAATPSVTVETGHKPVIVPLPGSIERKGIREQSPTAPAQATAAILRHPALTATDAVTDPLLAQMLRTETAKASAHETYLRVANGISLNLSRIIAGYGAVPAAMSAAIPPAPAPAPGAGDGPAAVRFDRAECLAFARDAIAGVLGPRYAGIDAHPTRVRLPDEPLMLVDRILEVEGEPCSLGPGRVVTEHNVHPGAWYLDGGRIPTCIAVESGQADLFLSAWLGIDFITRGLAVYRLLDAEITFHDTLPGPGKVIRYDIHIDHFFRQGETRLFRFNFEGTVDGRPLLTMKNGCAGFFTRDELDAGRGIIRTALESRPQAGSLPADWRELAPMQRESYTDNQVQALRDGRLDGCFGPLFRDLPLQRPAGLPDGRMTLVHRVLDLDPAGGRYGLGIITGEADIHPDDWFLTCHFVDDQVMPGTLMYECCLHTLRIYLARMGWVGEASEVVYEPVPGVTGRLKCRGQVIASTAKVQYEISLKALGYQDDGTPWVIADALMNADGRPIVQMGDMSLRLSGLDRETLEAMWAGRRGDAGECAPRPKQVLFDAASILAFATGRPSEAFGEKYRPFDEDRIIARLPGPPYQFLDRIVSIEDCEAWRLQAGGMIEAEYDVPPDAWYFAADRQRAMPFSVLLEAALQPCGWLAAYLGSALSSAEDLSFRNLGGAAVQSLAVTPETGTLTTRVKITNVAHSGGMIIQNFDYEVRCDRGTVYKGDTYFGFFSKAALKNQVGIREAEIYQPTTEEIARARHSRYPDNAPYPDRRMRMIDDIEFYDPSGGPHGLGYIRGGAGVDPDAWFFKAHFHQDPVWPGSLGLESFIQLLKVAALDRWPAPGGSAAAFESMALDQPHRWLYRGQILPGDARVTVEAVVTAADDRRQLLQADGYLSVDGRIIYQMTDFTLRMAAL